MATTSPPPPSPPPLPLQAISPPKPKPIPSPWSYTETLNLINIYKKKWYSLNRGQLKATQWQDLSISLSKTSSLQPKTATQCRHKIEKLRKRYRAEKNKPNPRAWEYFDLMHALHHGIVQNIRNPDTNIDCEEGHPGFQRRTEIDKDEEEMVNLVNYARPIATVRNNANTNPNFNRRRVEIAEEETVNFVNFAKSNSVGDQRGYFDRSESSESEGEEEREEKGFVLAGEIRRFAERVVRVGERKMEMMRETERYRMEMEKRTTEMIRESQRKVVDTIARAFGSHDNNKKMKMEMD